MNNHGSLFHRRILLHVLRRLLFRLLVAAKIVMEIGTLQVREERQTHNFTTSRIGAGSISVRFDVR